MDDTQERFESILKTLANAESLFTDGHEVEAVCKQLGVDRDTLFEWVNRFSLPPNCAEVLSKSHISNAVFPIFVSGEDHNGLEQVGSGVAIEIGEQLFALTAAHVTDYTHGNGALFMPAVDRIDQMTGGISFNPAQDGRPRTDDRIDVGYYRLSDDWRAKLHPNIKPLSLDDLLLTDTLETGDHFTFVGYPWRKGKSYAGVKETELLTYTGHASATDIYKKLGCDRSQNVLIRMRRKRTHSTLYNAQQTAPHPQGISGGAVISWPQDIIDRADPLKLKLAAISHTYHEREHCMAGTRIIPYLMGIVQNNPELAKFFMPQDVANDFGAFLAEKMRSLNPKNVLSAVGIGWYRPETYTKCLEIFSDRLNFPESYEEWEILAQRTERQMIAQGMRVIRAEIDPATFPLWCSNNGFTTIDQYARMAFGNATTLEMLRKER